MENSFKNQRLYIQRVIQLDSIEFDKAIRNILSNQLLEIGKFLKPGILNPVQPELQLIIDWLIFKNSIAKHHATFGQRLMNLQYASLSNNQKNWYGFLNYFLPYLKSRFDQSLRADYRTLRVVVDGLFNVGKLLHLVNLLLFLREGWYPSFIDRLLGLRYSSVQQINRNVGYNYIARELLWHGFMELFMLTLPLINLSAVKRRIKSVFEKAPSCIQVPAPILDLNTQCCVCNFRPNMPCRVSIYCAHVACYFCLKANIMNDNKFTCPQCGVQNTASRNFEYIKNQSNSSV